jgi:preprotein translocase subunit SecA
MIVGAGRARSLSAGAIGMTGGAAAAGGQDWSTVGRNDPCPCGSGKKFKKCHGAGS